MVERMATEAESRVNISSRYTLIPHFWQVAIPEPSAKGKTQPNMEVVPTPGATDATYSEWVPVHPLASATDNTPGSYNTDIQANHGGSDAQKARWGSSKSLDEGAPMRDAESGALVWSSPGGNGSVVVVYEDRLTVTTHADGTVQRWRPGEGDGHSVDSGLVLVECPGFASIEVSL